MNNREWYENKQIVPWYAFREEVKEGIIGRRITTIGNNVSLWMFQFNSSFKSKKVLISLRLLRLVGVHLWSHRESLTEPQKSEVVHFTDVLLWLQSQFQMESQQWRDLHLLFAPYRKHWFQWMEQAQKSNHFTNALCWNQ